MKISWDDYKKQASNDIALKGALIYRGQKNVNWNLSTTIHRTAIVKNPHDLKFYADVHLKNVHSAIEAWVGRTWNLNNSTELAEFLAYLQHNGFPTPLLDWTLSPYIAAYFAFEGINHFSPQKENVAIYAFDRFAWNDKVKQSYTFDNYADNVSLLYPRIFGNHKLAVQQGCFMFSNVTNIEEHIKSHEVGDQKFLTKYEIDIRERPKIMRELSLMGISAIQLMPSVESVCKKALEDIIGLVPLEKSL
jgi:FRG domain